MFTFVAERIYIFRKWRHSPYEDRTQHAFNTYNNNKLINCNTESYIIVFKTNIKFIPDYFSTTVTFLYYCNNMSKTSNEHKLWNIYFLFVIHIERCFQLPTALDYWNIVNIICISQIARIQINAQLTQVEFLGKINYIL